MAIIRDMIPAFELFQPNTVDDALALLDEHRGEAWVLAGGLDSYDWFKDRIKRPAVVVDLGGIEELHGITEEQGGLTIGAMTSLTEVVNHARVQSDYSLLATAAEHVATPQIRNQGTLGGNIAQDTRCWYYRSGWPCYRAGGNTCYAAAPKAMNRKGSDSFTAHRLRATRTCWLMATAITGMNIMTECTIDSVTTHVGTGPPIR